MAIFNLMEDVATAEIARSQVWQWLHNDIALDSGQAVTKELVERIIDEELRKIQRRGRGRFRRRPPSGRAVALFSEVALAEEFAEFLTLPAYERCLECASSDELARATAPATRRSRPSLTDPTELRTYECDGLSHLRAYPGLVAAATSTERGRHDRLGLRGARCAFRRPGLGDGPVRPEPCPRSRACSSSCRR